MPLLDRSDLKYDYTWSTAPANKPHRDTMSEDETRSRMFRRDEGDEVLSFINEFSRDYGINDKQEALEIERLIRDELKNKDMSRKEVRLWLNEHRKKREI